MLVYDLICSQGHQFEGWFKNLTDLKAQLRKGLLTCPVCGEAKVSKKPSTFGLMKSRPENAPPAAAAPPKAAGGPVAPRLPDPEEFLRQLEEFSQRMQRDFDDVGAEFAAEALKMHYGSIPKKNIRGLSSPSQEEVLRKEGVEFYKVPILNRKSPAPGNRGRH